MRLVATENRLITVIGTLFGARVHYAYLPSIGAQRIYNSVCYAELYFNCFTSRFSLCGCLCVLFLFYKSFLFAQTWTVTFVHCMQTNEDLLKLIENLTCLKFYKKKKKKKQQEYRRQLLLVACRSLTRVILLIFSKTCNVTCHSAKVSEAKQQKSESLSCWLCHARSAPTLFVMSSGLGQKVSLVYVWVEILCVAFCQLCTICYEHFSTLLKIPFQKAASRNRKSQYLSWGRIFSSMCY